MDVSAPPDTGRAALPCLGLRISAQQPSCVCWSEGEPWTKESLASTNGQKDACWWSRCCEENAQQAGSGGRRRVRWAGPRGRAVGSFLSAAHGH